MILHYIIMRVPIIANNYIYKDILKENTGINLVIILLHFGLDFYSGINEISSNLYNK